MARDSEPAAALLNSTDLQGGHRRKGPNAPYARKECSSVEIAVPVEHQAPVEQNLPVVFNATGKEILLQMKTVHQMKGVVLWKLLRQ